MKINLFVALLLFAHTVSAQLTISTGAKFSITDNGQLTLQNTNLINDGNFFSGNSVIIFTGNTTSSISGSQPVQFYELAVNKSNGCSVQLQRTISVLQRILFTAGFLNLNGFNADLSTTGHLDGELENTRVIGQNGGEVLFNVNLNQPANSNPANLGAFITSGQNLGNVIIRRGHQSQTNNAANSILRYYDIIPTNNSNLNATLRLTYMNGELNNLDESALLLAQSSNNIDWTDLGVTIKDTVANFDEKPGVGSFSRFTLFSNAAPLPVRFIFLNAKCESFGVVVTWKTSQEQGSSHFTVERSEDGIRWAKIGNLPAAGNSTTEKYYSFTDNNSLQNTLYRIAESDLDGKIQYSAALRSSCAATEAINVWPNPVHDQLFINITTGKASDALIKLFDSKGALVKTQNANLLQGNNQHKVAIQTLANGIYHISVEWNKGQMKKTLQIVKQ